MKILHCCLACFYVDNYSYQENILPKYHKKMGHEVMIVASTESFDKNGLTTYVKTRKYVNEDGIPVIRLPYVRYLPHALAKKIRRYIGLQNCLEEFHPDIIFLHDIQFLDIDIIRDFVKKNGVRVIADCHTDFLNSGRNFLSKYILHKCIYKHCAKQIEPYTSKFYGVLPARVDFLKYVYKLPEEKCDLLVLGADDELVEMYNSDESVNKTRKELGIKENEFLIMTGGKIDNNKLQVITLMKVIKSMNKPNIKLVLFGSVIPDLQKKVNELCDNNHILFIGWKTSQDAVKYFASADLVVFPGKHSVFWEQVCGLGIPMIVRRWDGFTHIDLGKNVEFLESDDPIEMSEKIECIVNNCDKYKNMKNAAREKGMEVFSYSNIAYRSLE